MKKTLALMLALMLALSLAATAEESPQEIMDQGVEAYLAGDYLSAFGRFYTLAESGDSAAQFNLGIMYAHGEGVTQSYEKAAEYYLMAAEQGHADAQYCLGVLYDLGNGVEQSYEKAAEYYRLAADQGNSAAQYNLGIMYLRGEGVEHSAEQAAEYLRLAAEQGHADAQYNLALMHQNGEGMEPSEEKALEYYAMAADQGHAGAQYNLAVMYQDGIGTAADPEKALKYYLMAAEQDHVNALFNLGVAYDRGTIVEQSFEKAAEYYSRSAELGDDKAQYNLAVMYLDGKGVEPSIEQAAKYFRMAAEQGNEPAQEKLESLEAALAVAGEDPLRAEALAIGLTLPEPGEGERLFLGIAEVPDTRQTRVFLSFVLAPNGMSVRQMDLYGEAVEVPLEGSGNIHLIDAETTTPEDYWIALEHDKTDIVFNSETGKGVYELRIDGDTAACRVVLAGRYEDSGSGAKGDFHTEAELTLHDLTGESARAAVDPPTRDDALALGMELPVPGDGEALYLGAANVSQAETVCFAFILTADGQSVRSPMLLIRNMDITYAMGDKQVHITSSSQSTSYSGERAVAEEMDFGSFRLSGFALDGDAASGVLHYTYHDNTNDYDYPFDAAQVAFAKAE